MALTIQQILTPQTSAQIRATMVTTLVSLGIPADKWRSGGVASTMLTVVSMTLALFSSLIVSFVSGFFLPTATGQGLVLLAYYVYGVTAPTATFATGAVTLTNSGGGVYVLNPGDLVVQNPTTKVTYTNTGTVNVGANATVTGVQVQAQTVGSAGNSNPGTVTVMVTTLLGVTVSNPTAIAGSDAISDANLRTLCTNKLGALSVRGPRTAYAYAIQVATNPITGAQVNINRWSISASSHTGIVTVYVASPSGAPDSNDVTGVGNSIEAIARPDAVTVNLNAAVAVNYSPTVTFYVRVGNNATVAQIQTAIANAITSFISTYDIGGLPAGDDLNPTFTGLFAGGIYGAAAEGCQSIGVTYVSGSGAQDLAMTAGQVVVDAVTVNVRIVPTMTS